MKKNKPKSQQKNRVITSIVIIAASLILTYAPISGLQQTIVIVSGTELQEPLKQLEAEFEQQNPNIKLELKFQGSQELVNKYLNDKNDFKPTVLIPANGILLTELSERYKSTNNTEAFYDTPRPIAKTMLVGIAWQERGKVIFPDGIFRWERLENAIKTGNWEKIGGKNNWGSFDFVTTDPTRSNSGQLTLSLWAQSKLGTAINSTNLNNPTIESLFSLVKKSVYQPPRSTDILLQEFIAKGANDGDVATVYESIALHRWEQSTANQGKPYQIYYLNPTVETVSTAAIVRQNVDTSTANAARKFIDFLALPQQQAVFVQYGFRPVNNSVNLKTVPNSPWSKNIPGAEVKPSIQTLPPPNTQVITEIQRLWERAN
jgi:ABC-type molybdate transport system substrate-binding protein